MKLMWRILSSWLLVVAWWPLPILAQSALTADQQRAMEHITEQRVTTTISFLASDELAGRDTPSPGLRVAAAYVAARFRGAGLEGGGANGSFYQMASIDRVQTPNSGVVLTDAQGEPIPHFGLLAGGPIAVEASGPVAPIQWRNEIGDSRWTGPVIAKYEGTDSTRRATYAIARTTRQLHEAGATALLLQVDPDHQLIVLAQQNRAQSRAANPRATTAIPVLLVPMDIELNGAVSLQLPAEQKVAEPVANVIGVLRGKGTELANEAILVSAHLDHLGQREGAEGDNIYNGADDNASGVTGVLMLADAFAALDTRPERTVIFVAYWGEERGLLGSRYMVQNPVWPLQQIKANINLEMIGRPEAGAREKIWMTGWEQSDLGELMAAGAKRAEVDVFEHPQFSSMLYRASDNWPLVEAGLIAHSFSAGSLHKDYHQPGDEWEKLDLPHMTRVIRGLFAGSLPIADATVTPQKSANRR